MSCHTCMRLHLVPMHMYLVCSGQSTPIRPIGPDGPMGVRFVPRWEIPIWPIRWPPIRLFYHLYSIRGCCCTRGPEYTFAFAIRIITFFPDEVFTRWSRRTCFPDGPDGLVCPMGPMGSCSIFHLEPRFPMGSFPDGPDVFSHQGNLCNKR